jgi:hypothetical protein
MSNSRKSFRIPVMVGLILALILVVSGASFAYAKYAYSDSFQSSITILSDKIGLYTSETCDTPFNTNVSLGFGSIYGGANSTIVNLVLRNESDGASYIKPQISVEGLPEGFQVWELSDKGGRIPNSPEWLSLYTPEKLEYTTTGLTGLVGYENLNANATLSFISINNMPSSGWCLIDQEIIRYTGTITTASERWQLTGLQRGQCGTAPAMHERASTITFINEPTYVAFDALELNEVQKIMLMVKTTEEVESGDVNFNILVQAEAEH